MRHHACVSHQTVHLKFIARVPAPFHRAGGIRVPSSSSTFLNSSGYVGVSDRSLPVLGASVARGLVIDWGLRMGARLEVRTPERLQHHRTRNQRMSWTRLRNHLAASLF